MYLPKALFLSTYCRSSALWRFFKAGALGCYDPQIIKPPEVLLGWIREALDETIDEIVGGDRALGLVGISESPAARISTDSSTHLFPIGSGSDSASTPYMILVESR